MDDDDNSILLLLNGHLGGSGGGGSPSRRRRHRRLYDSEQGVLEGLRVSQDGRLVDDVLEEHEATFLGKSTHKKKPLVEVSTAMFPDDEELEEEAFSDVCSVRSSTFASKKNWRERCERLERKNEELRLRLTGLTRSIRESGRTHAALKESLAEREGELSRARQRIAALGTAAVERPAVREVVRTSREERRKVDELSIELIEAKRRERRAVEIGSALRRRVGEERERIERAEERSRLLEMALKEAREEADREREKGKRERAAAVAAKTNRDRLEEVNADLRARLEQAAAIADEQRSRFHAAKQKLETARDLARAKSLDENNKAQLARDECLALKAELASARASERRSQRLRQVLDRVPQYDDDEYEFEELQPRTKLGDVINRVPAREDSLARPGKEKQSRKAVAKRNSSPVKQSRKEERLVVIPASKSRPRLDEDEAAEDPSTDDEDRLPSSLPRQDPQRPKISEEKPTSLPPRVDKTTARFERLRATFDRVASSQNRR